MSPDLTPEQIADYARITGLTVEQFANFDAYARRRLNKSVVECTRDEIQALGSEAYASAARATVEGDQVRAALTDTADCGCSALAPRDPDTGEWDYSRVRVSHTCGRTS